MIVYFISILLIPDLSLRMFKVGVTVLLFFEYRNEASVGLQGGITSYQKIQRIVRKVPGLKQKTNSG